MNHLPIPCCVAGLLALSGCYLFSSGEIDQACRHNPAACPGASDGDNGDTADTDADLVLLSISPAYGHSSGGYTLELRGNGFQSGSTVTIGGDEVEILSLNAGTISLQAAARNPGVSDVAIARPDGQNARLENGFEVFEDTDGELQFVAHLVQWASTITGEVVSEGYGYWVENSEVRFWELYGADQEDFDDPAFQGGCKGEISDVPWTTRQGDFSNMVLVGEDAEVSLDHDGGGTYYFYETGSALIPIDQPLSLAPYAFAPNASVGIDTFAVAPHEIVGKRDDHYHLFDGDPTQEIPGDVQIVLDDSNDTSGDPDYKMMVFGSVSTGGEQLARIYCVAPDDGHMRLDPNAWHYDGTWPVGRDMLLAIGRTRTHEARLPHNNATASVSITHVEAVVGVAGPRED